MLCKNRERIEKREYADALEMSKVIPNPFLEQTSDIRFCMACYELGYYKVEKEESLDGRNEEKKLIKTMEKV